MNQFLPQGNTGPEQRPGRKLELETLELTEFTQLCLVVIHVWSVTSESFVSRNSRKRDEVWVRLLSTFNIQWEGTVSGNRGLDLLISGTYIPKINLKIFSQNSGIWEADTSIMQRDSTRKRGKSTWYLGGENSPRLSGHILNTASITAKGTRR